MRFKLYLFFFGIIINCFACSADKKQGSPSNNTDQEKINKNIYTNDIIYSILLKNYENNIDSIKNNTIFFKNNKELIFDDGLNKTIKEKLKYSDVEDQFSQLYPLTEKYKTILKVNYDPGRYRNIEFFKNIYGANQKEVEKNLIKINWFGRDIYINKINNLHLKLDSIQKELLELEDSKHKFFKKTTGTFVWRKIAGTDRLSVHSFGIAIDLNIQYADYWRWNKPGKKGNYEYKNRIPYTIIEIFEKYGFIWGGKWYHYDTMHFEYRPELIEYAQILNKIK